MEDGSCKKTNNLMQQVWPIWAYREALRPKWAVFVWGNVCLIYTSKPVIPKEIHFQFWYLISMLLKMFFCDVENYVSVAKIKHANWNQCCKLPNILSTLQFALLYMVKSVTRTTISHNSTSLFCANAVFDNSFTSLQLLLILACFVWLKIILNFTSA